MTLSPCSGIAIFAGHATSWSLDGPVHARLPVECSAAEWIRWCDLMGLQRNLKIVGIFARLKHRDGKEGYVEMIPQFLSIPAGCTAPLS